MAWRPGRGPRGRHILMGVAVLRLLAIGCTGEPRTLQLRPEEPIPVLAHAHFETPVWTRRRSAAARDAGGMRHHGDFLPRAILLCALGAGGTACRRVPRAR